MTIFNFAYLIENILANLSILIDIIDTKFIILTSSLIGVLSIPIFLSGLGKKVADKGYQVIQTICVGTAAYVGTREVVRDTRDLLNKKESDNKTNSSGSQSSSNNSSGKNNSGNNKSSAGDTSKN